MKYVIWLMVLGVILALQNRLDNNACKKMGLNLANYSFSNGCYSEAIRVCGAITDDMKRSVCHTDALNYCPLSGKQFAEWLSMGAK